MSHYLSKLQQVLNKMSHVEYMAKMQLVKSTYSHIAVANVLGSGPSTHMVAPGDLMC